MGFLKLQIKTGFPAPVTIQINCQVNFIGVSLVDSLLFGGSLLNAHCVEALCRWQRWTGHRWAMCSQNAEISAHPTAFGWKYTKKIRAASCSTSPGATGYSNLCLPVVCGRGLPCKCHRPARADVLRTSNVLLNHALVNLNPALRLNIAEP